MTRLKRNLLLEWLTSAEGWLQELGYEVSIQAQSQSNTSTAVDLDGRGLVGTICYWPPNTFEFQVNASKSGEVLALETKTIPSTKQLSHFIEGVLRKAEKSTKP